MDILSNIASVDAFLTFWRLHTIEVLSISAIEALALTKNAIYLARTSYFFTMVASIVVSTSANGNSLLGAHAEARLHALGWDEMEITARGLQASPFWTCRCRAVSSLEGTACEGSTGGLHIAKKGRCCHPRRSITA